MEIQDSDTVGGTRIHPTAVVHPNAQLSSDVVIGPCSVVGRNVAIGDGCRIGAHVVIDGHTTIGRNNSFLTGAVIGSQPQDLKYHGGKTRLVIGDNNVVREYTTINTATSEENVTSVGDNNLLMAYTHVAHECRICNGVIMANAATLAGHVTIEDKAVLGGLVGVHQFVHVGTMALIGGCSKAIKDVPPYSMVDGNPTTWHGVNFVGLKRNGVPEEVRANIKKAFKIICRSNLNTTQALEKLRAEFDSCAEIDHLIEFIEKSSRGICK
ncbi:acyl-ACP--UDP-N-acetylglucosamine O-acyltransferase [Candidatus Poribacteria bacterium]|nr:acyl-ACP--UDP-N-acetylglucosamine O-acyltransferase [Candidatus Poribacteria bacterium]